MDVVFKEFPISLEYVVYCFSAALILICIVLLEAKLGLSLLVFCAGLIAVFFSLISSWDLIAIGIVKHRILGVIFVIITLFLFLGLIYDFVQAL